MGYALVMKTRAVKKTSGAKVEQKSSFLNARIRPKLKRDAEAVFDKIGISTTDALTVFLRQVVMHRGMPFPVNVPNRETIKALRELEEGGGTRIEGGNSALYAALRKPARKRLR